MFQSSKHVPPDSHFQLLEAAGASDINGTTDFDRTNYFETVPSNQLELALWLESDRMGYLLDKVDQAALSNQQDVVRNERRQSVENQPYGLAEEALVQMLFPKGHPYYGNVIGSHEDIQAAKLDDVKRVLQAVLRAQQRQPRDRRRLRPGADEGAGREVLRHAEARPGGPADQGGDAEDHGRAPQGREGARRAAARLHGVADVADSSSRATPMRTSRRTILGGGRSSRLYKKLVYEKQIAQNVSAQQYSLMLGSIFQIEATARPGHTVEELEKAIDEELAAFRAAARRCQ